MKYTPEELLEYVKGNPELYTGALNALFNNDKGFGYLPVDPETFRIDKGKACVVMPMFKDGEWQDEEIAFSPDDIDDEMLEHTDPEKLRIFMVMCGDKLQMRFISDNGPEDGEYEEGRDVDGIAQDYLLLDFFQLTEINTKGRLKAAIKKGWEMFEEDAAMREERELFLDACGVEEDYL